MDDGTDRELLQRYAESGDEAAFAGLVRAHVDLVYSVALRLVGGQAQLAQDVSQQVFTALARQARPLTAHTTLVGWLHTTTRNLSSKAVRSERRRRAHEQEATAMHHDSALPEMNWAEIGPLLDEAVGQLRRQDREAVLLRFFKNLSHQEVGAALGLGEDAARKRVDRALEKLREHFARRGFAASAGLLAASMAGNSVQAAPADLAANITTTALTGAGGSAAGSVLLLNLFYMSTKTKLIAATAAMVAIAATMIVNWPQPTADAATTRPAPMPVARPVPIRPAIARGNMPTVAPGADSTVMTDNGVIVEQYFAEPQAELTTAIATGLHFLQAQDAVSFLKTLTSPDALGTDENGIPSPQVVASLQNPNPDTFKKLGELAEVLSAIQGMTPIMNDAGTRATYQFDSPIAGREMIFFNKVNGFWYFGKGMVLPLGGDSTQKPPGGGMSLAGAKAAASVNP